MFNDLNSLIKKMKDAKAQKLLEESHITLSFENLKNLFDLIESLESDRNELIEMINALGERDKTGFKLFLDQNKGKWNAIAHFTLT